MPRRVSLPGADELFRTTGGAALQPSTPGAARREAGASHEPAPVVPAPAGEQDPAEAPAQSSPASTHGFQGRSGATGSAEHSGRGGDEDSRPGARVGQQARSAPRLQDAAAGTAQLARAAGGPAAAAAEQPRRRGRGANRRPSGRERHDEKITVYVSAEELMDLEHARLVLRGEHGLAVDRGRIVREAVAVVLADLESRGDASILVRRLRGR